MDSNVSISSEISVRSIKFPSSRDITAPRSISWQKLTPKSSPGVTRIKSASFLKGSKHVDRTKKLPLVDSPAYITCRKPAIVSPQTSPSTSPVTANRVSTFVLDSNQPTESQSDGPALFLTAVDDRHMSQPKVGFFTPTLRVRKNDSHNEQSLSSVPSLDEPLDDSLVNDPPCSNSLLCAFETLTTAGLRSGRSRGLANRPHSMHKNCVTQPSLLHEALASTKRHLMKSRVECKDSDGNRISYPSQLSITAHDQGTVMYMPSKMNVLSRPKAGGATLWCLPKPEGGYKPPHKIANGKPELVVSEQYHRELTWQNSMREETLSPWTSGRKL